MGKLIDRKKLERAKKQRVERRKKILEVARSTFSRLPLVEVTLDSIGQRAGVDRGVASMHFRTEAELFLLLLKDELGEWYTEIEETLDDGDVVVSKSELAGLLASTLAARTELTRFLSIEHVVLEQNIEPMEAFHFQRWRLDRMTALGSTLERAAEGLGAGEGIRLLHRVQLLAGSLRPAAVPKGAAAYELGDPDFAVFAVDFESELQALISAWIESRREDA
jgi:AcrR family transcriptional regulator